MSNERRYSQESDCDVQYNENGPSEHLWAGIAPNNEANRLNLLQENGEALTNLNQDDINDNNALITNVSSQSCIIAEI